MGLAAGPRRAGRGAPGGLRAAGRWTRAALARLVGAVGVAARGAEGLVRTLLRVLTTLSRAAADRVEELARALVAALVTAFAEPRAARARSVRLRLWPGSPGRQVDLVTVGDVVLTAVLYVAVAVSLLDRNEVAADPLSARVLHLVAAVSVLPVLLRDRWPLAAWRSSLLALIWTGQVLFPLYPEPAFPLAAGAIIAYLVTLYPVASRTERRVAFGAWVVSLLAVALNGALTAGPAGVLMVWPFHVAVAAVMTAVPLLFGHNVRTRRQALRQLADQQRRSDQERDRRAVLEERGRIARELHDVVAHHMSVIAIQAEAAPLRAGDADELRGELTEIRRTALEALTEMRKILGVLREEESRPETAPQPGLEQLGDLVERAHTGGLQVRVALADRPGALPPLVGLSAYRIVQESLSNAMRHAPGSLVDVQVAYDERPAAVRLSVESSAPAPGRRVAVPAGPGHGLAGMRERAAILGGELTAGPTADGGFRVLAVLPLEEP